MNADDPNFLLQLTGWQNRLFGYLVTLLGNVHDASDVLQETNLVILRRADSFSEGTDFGKWARAVAHFQALAFLRDRRRSQRALDPEILAILSEAQVRGEEDEERELALRHCLALLDDHQRQLVKRHYEDGEKFVSIAEGIGEKVGTLRMRMMRIRQGLLECVEAQLSRDEKGVSHG